MERSTSNRDAVNYVYLDFDNMSDSRELMESKQPLSISVFTYTLLAIIVILIVFSCFFRLDEFASITGQVQSINPVSDVIIMNNGKLAATYITEGMPVKKGDLLFDLDTEAYIIQKSDLESANSKLSLQIEMLNKLKTSIQSEANLFNNSDNEGEYYAMYEQFQKDLDISISQLKDNEEATQGKVGEIQEITKTINSSIQKYKNRKIIYTKLFDSIKTSTSFKSDDLSANALYDDFIVNFDKANSSYDYYEKQYKAAKKEYENALDKSNANSSIVTSADISSLKQKMENAEYSMKSMKSELDSVVSTYALRASSVIDECDISISSLEAEKDKAQASLSNLFDNPSIIDNTKEKLKLDKIASIDSQISTVQKEKESNDKIINEVNDSIKNASYRASCDGVATLVQNLNVGDNVQTGTRLLQIVPTDSMKMTLFIPENEISKMNEHQKVTYSYNAMPAYEYGKSSGEIGLISATTTTGDDGKLYYLAESSINKVTFVDKSGKSRNVKTGMLVDVKVVTGSKSLIIWALEKMNLIN